MLRSIVHVIICVQLAVFTCDMRLFTELPAPIFEAARQTVCVGVDSIEIQRSALLDGIVNVRDEEGLITAALYSPVV